MRRVLGFLAVLMVLAAFALPAHSSTTAVVGQPQKIWGPSAEIDSLYSTIKDSHGVHGYMSEINVYWFDQRKDGTLTNERVVMTHGPVGSVDQCGVHPVGTIYKDPANPDKHWIGFYHAERSAPVDNGKCNHQDGHTRWTIVRMVTYDGGKTWRKGDQVITQDKALLSVDGHWSYRTDDTGSPHMIVKNGYFYMYYRAANRDSNYQQMSIARAPVSGNGMPGTWMKWYNGAWSEPGVGGRQSNLPGIPAQARGISWNSYLGKWLAVKVDIRGIDLFTSTDKITWQHYQRILRTGLTYNAWHKGCIPNLPVAYGYGSIISTRGSSASSGRSFYVYYMKKPAGKCFDTRYLYRRLVTLN